MHRIGPYAFPDSSPQRMGESGGGNSSSSSSSIAAVPEDQTARPRFQEGFVDEVCVECRDEAGRQAGRQAGRVCSRTGPSFTSSL